MTGLTALVFMLALQAPPVPPGGCEGYEAHSEFDFWIGEWNVYSRDGSFAGQNRISRESSGCLLLERWRSATGREGTSMNFIDPDTQGWRQIWVGSNNFIDYDGGLTETGQMRLDGRIVYFSDSGTQSFDFRGIWTPSTEGHVIQYFQQYDPETQSWQDWALLTYVPRGEDPNGTEPDEDALGPRIKTPPSIETRSACSQ